METCENPPVEKFLIRVAPYLNKNLWKSSSPKFFVWVALQFYRNFVKNLQVRKFMQVDPYILIPSFCDSGETLTNFEHEAQDSRNISLYLRPYLLKIP